MGIPNNNFKNHFIGLWDVNGVAICEGHTVRIFRNGKDTTLKEKVLYSKDLAAFTLSGWLFSQVLNGDKYTFKIENES